MIGLVRSVSVGIVMPAVLLTLLGAAPARGGEITNAGDHLLTGFPLTGAHVIVPCQQCHSRGIFEGLPTRCTWCHTQGSPVAATTKPLDHVPTTIDCDTCHTDRSWHVARFDHVWATAPCATCHNNVTSRGKPSSHVPTALPCDSCHNTVRWKSSARVPGESKRVNAGKRE